MKPREFSAGLDLSALLGATVDAYAQDEGYWHLYVALRLIGKPPLVLTTEEHSAGHRFEVFSIRTQGKHEAEYIWQSLHRPVVVSGASPLWRCEWLEEGASGETLGSDPATQYAGRGPAPSNATVNARVRAGILLEGTCSERVVIAASDSAPFNVEVFLSEQAVKSALEKFEPVRSNPSFKRTPDGAA